MEILIAILFISIGFFGYVALHSRLLHSGVRLEKREQIRAATDLIEAIDFSRGLLGMEGRVDDTPFTVDPLVPNLRSFSTDPKGRSLSWVQQLPEEHRLAADQALPLEVKVYRKPFVNRWNSR